MAWETIANEVGYDPAALPANSGGEVPRLIGSGGNVVLRPDFASLDSDGISPV